MIILKHPVKYQIFYFFYLSIRTIEKWYSDDYWLIISWSLIDFIKYYLVVIFWQICTLFKIYFTYHNMNLHHQIINWKFMNIYLSKTNHIEQLLLHDHFSSYNTIFYYYPSNTYKSYELEHLILYVCVCVCVCQVRSRKQ